MKKPKSETAPKVDKAEWKQEGLKSAKQYIFCHEYIIEGGNGAAAARKAKYANARQAASRLLTYDYIRVYISKLMAAYKVEAEEVLFELSKMARGFDPVDYVIITEKYGIGKDGTEYFSGFATSWNLDKLKKDGYSKLIKSIKTIHGSVVLEWYSRSEALEMMGKHHKSFTEKHEHSGPDGGPIEVKGYVGITPDDWDETEN